MPEYDFKCDAGCHYDDDENDLVVFSVTLGMNDEKKATCPHCGVATTRRHYSPFAMHKGMTQYEKRQGTTKTRVEFGKYAREVRRVRKKDYGPGTYQGDSNELWTGSEIGAGYYKNVLPTPDEVKAKVGRPEQKSPTIRERAEAGSNFTVEQASEMVKSISAK